MFTWQFYQSQGAAQSIRRNFLDPHFWLDHWYLMLSISRSRCILLPNMSAITVYRTLASFTLSLRLVKLYFAEVLRVEESEMRLVIPLFMMNINFCALSKLQLLRILNNATWYVYLTIPPGEFQFQRKLLTICEYLLANGRGNIFSSQASSKKH